MREKLKVGSIWIYLPMNFDIKASDIFAKVIRVTDTHVYVIRKTRFGFEDLEPKIMKVEDFLEWYLFMAEDAD